jgi:hypothetical protein
MTDYQAAMRPVWETTVLVGGLASGQHPALSRNAHPHHWSSPVPPMPIRT